VNSANAVLYLNWSVWDDNPTVSWDCDGNTASIFLKKAPLSVAHLSAHSLLAIVGNYDEFGSKNLLLFSYDGTFQRTLIAPDLGFGAHFGSVAETQSGVCATVGFFDKTGWIERAGNLNLDDGTMEQLHRSY
jgi:hypothetical protein